MTAKRTAAPIPARAGIGLRAEHYREVTDGLPPVGWLEVHSENYFGGGAALEDLERARGHYPISLHGVGLSLGSSDELNRQHLINLKKLIERIEPGLVSDHLSWSSIDGVYLNDLLPLPYTEEALRHFTQRVEQAQDFLGRELLIENPSSYLCYAHSTIAEWDFISEIARVSGCGILLDVNNIHVSATNHGFDARHYLDAIPADKVREIHLAGFTVNHYPEGDILVDTHNAPVANDVWELYRQAVETLGSIPTLIEWDSDMPPLAVLLDEARKADDILETTHAILA